MNISSINSLPDLCMLAIFDRTPLAQLSSLQLVHPRWETLVKSAFCRRKVLMLTLGKKKLDIFERSVFKPSPCTKICDLHLPHHQHLHYNELQRLSKAKALSTKLPNIRRVIIAANQISFCTMKHLTDLLVSGWSKLGSVELHIVFNDLDEFESSNEWEERRHGRQQKNPQWMALYSLLAGLHELRSLHVEAPNTELSHLGTQLELPVLQHLEEFKFCSAAEDSLRMLRHSLMACGAANARLRRIHLNLGSTIQEALEYFPQRYTARNLKQFVLEEEEDYGALFRFCTHFPALEVLTLVIDRLSLYELVDCLRHLKHLHTITLFVNGQQLKPFSADNLRPQSDFSQLASVKNLTFDIQTPISLNLASIHLEYIFPNLTNLYFDGPLLCNRCYPMRFLFNALEGAKIHLLCINDMMAPFLSGLRLNQLYINSMDLTVKIH